MTFRPPAQPSRVGRLALRVTYVAIALAAAASMSGCPGGAELEDPERFPLVVGGFGPTTGGSGGVGVGGATGGAGAGGATGGSAGVAGSPAGGAGAGAAGGGAGTGSAGWTWTCTADVTMALKQNCSRAGCHSALDKYADLDMSNPAAIAARMVDQPALHGDIGCNPAGQVFRACTPDELLALGCPPNAKLIDSANFEASWVVTKLNGMQGECGDVMPIAPGNSATNGWNDDRKQCYMDFFRSLIAPQ